MVPFADAGSYVAFRLFDMEVPLCSHRWIGASQGPDLGGHQVRPVFGLRTADAFSAALPSINAERAEAAFVTVVFEVGCHRL